MSLHGTCVFRVLRCTRSDIYNRLKLLHRFSTSTCYGTAKKEDINLDDNPSSKSVQGPVEEVADIKISQDVAFTESLQPVRRPTNLDKICLLWAGKYKTRDDIPEFVKINQIS
ncbi:uncharacterized protein LOC127851853 isoform X2 [Dreissena polymorpha]|uniref:uncharacterized protein LOC127851853 isoform X2 n=1 Tax=Dreissena polymorpha TaxID=45954 RepID=UPI002264F14D|nr:uncharacterized protein LOC127851853 isoform X2 [Dreissena polymorpha]